MRTLWAAYVVLCGALSVGCLKPTPIAPPDPGPEETPAQQLELSSAVATEPASAARVAEVNQVKVNVQLRGYRSGTEVVTEFRAPDGSAYQSITQAPADDDGTLRQLEFVLPVAGTLVQSGGLTGAWNVKVLVNGAPAASHDFELAP